MPWHLVEKNNHLALHGVFDREEDAKRHLRDVVPEYVTKRYFMDKLLTADSFEIIEANP